MEHTPNTPHVIDLRFQGREQAIASYLLDNGREAALIETGPASTLGSLMAGLSAAGVEPERVTQLLVTHIHLDHAGAAGSLVRLLPNATVCVHEAGAPHLSDPSKLLSSATRIYGADMDRLWGEVRPVPPERLRVLGDGEKFTAGGRELHALYTPGHASHHIAYWDPASASVFTGDVAGIRLPGVKIAVPPTPPPDLDLDAWSASIDRLLGLGARTLYLTHFGAAHDVSAHLDNLRARLFAWHDLVLDAFRRGLDTPQVALLLEQHANRELSASGLGPGLSDRYRLVSGYEMNVAGFVRYFRKRGELPG